MLRKPGIFCIISLALLLFSMNVKAEISVRNHKGHISLVNEQFRMTLPAGFKQYYITLKQFQYYQMHSYMFSKMEKSQATILNLIILSFQGLPKAQLDLMRQQRYLEAIQSAIGRFQDKVDPKVKQSSYQKRLVNQDYQITEVPLTTGKLLIYGASIDNRLYTFTYALIYPEDANQTKKNIEAELAKVQYS